MVAEDSSAMQTQTPVQQAGVVTPNDKFDKVKRYIRSKANRQREYQDALHSQMIDNQRAGNDVR